MTVIVTKEQGEFVESFRTFLDQLDYRAHGLGIAWQEPEKEERKWFYQALYENGWTGVGWPKEFGGLGRSAIEQWLYIEELSYRHLPFGGLTVTSIGPTIIRFGTDQQKAELLPKILRGDIDIAIGYTEPEAGSDLGSLRCQARRDGDVYRINGQKIFTTAAHYSTHIWLAARTGTQEARGRGVSIILVPTTSKGITIHPLMTQSGGRTNQVFFDDVVVPVDQRVGEENEGWNIIMSALSFERIIPYGSVARWFDLTSRLRSKHRATTELLEDPYDLRAMEFAAELEISALFAERTAREIEAGRVPNVEASISKVWLSEFRERVAKTTLDFVGPEGQLGLGAEDAPAGGIFDYLYRLYPMMKIGGGNNEVQRNIIAQRGLGLPR